MNKQTGKHIAAAWVAVIITLATATHSVFAQVTVNPASVTMYPGATTNVVVIGALTDEPLDITTFGDVNVSLPPVGGPGYWVLEIWTPSTAMAAPGDVVVITPSGGGPLCVIPVTIREEPILVLDPDPTGLQTGHLHLHSAPDPVQVGGVSGTTNGSVTWFEAISADTGLFTVTSPANTLADIKITPVLGADGTADLTVIAHDGVLGGTSLPQTVSVTVMPQIKVTYNGNGGDPVTTNILYDLGEPYGSIPTPMPMPERTGYTFIGWFTEATNGTEVVGTDFVTDTSPDTLYAQWTAKIYTVTFNATGGEPSSIEIDQTFGEPYQMPFNPIRDGQLFVGWYTNNLIDHVRVYLTNTDLVQTPTDHTLYAEWYIPSGTQLYVRETGGDDSKDGLSWGTARKTIQSAINTASANAPTRYGINVFRGTYGPILTTNLAVTIRGIHGAEHTFIDGGGTTRCATLGIFGPETATNTVLTGFTLMNGNGTNGDPDATYLNGYGGGSLGGTLIDCVLSNNTATIGGGGTYYGVLNGGTLTHNTAPDGGGSFNSILAGCELSGNTASNRGGGAFNGTLTNCTLIGNTADNGGGASGGNSSNCELSKCTLTNNTATTNGGGAYDSKLNECSLIGNTAANDGGGAYDSTLSHCFLTGNVATNNGGGAYSSVSLNCLLTGNTAIINGGGASGGTLINCTVWGNTADSGGGTSGSTVLNCIVWENFLSNGITLDNYSGGEFDNSCTMPLPLPPVGGLGNIDDDPLFMDAASGDFRLQVISPCKDSGNNAFVDAYLGWGEDLDKNPRTFNGVVDMGAYEYVPVECEVTFKDGLGFVTPTPTNMMLVTQGLAYGTLADVDRTGYTFQGWFDDPTGGTQVFDTTIVTNDGPHMLYAQWTTNQYTVNYYGDDGTFTTTGTTPDSYHFYDIPANLSSNEFERTGYTFAGWTNAYDTIVLYDDGQLVTNLTDQDGGVVELFATWKPIHYTVEYDGNGATGGMTPDSSHLYDVPTNLTLNGFTRVGYLFDGWSWTAAGSVDYTNGEVVVNLTATPDAKFPLYAQWVTNSHTVTFVGNGGEPPVQTKPQAYGEPYVLPFEPIRSDYDFAGWFTDPVGGTLVTGGTINGQTTDHTLYAHWTSAPVGMRLYVNDSTGDDSEDGFSWDTAKKTIQAAVDIAPAGFEIHVAHGTYAPFASDNLAVTIYGVHGAEYTIIDGGGGMRCATLAAVGPGLPTNTVLIGFTLTGGNGTHPVYTLENGNGGGSLGGTLIDCVLSNNTAAAWGGGAYYGVLNGCSLTHNTATVGGGTYNSTLNGCELSGNTAATNGGGAFNGTLTDCTLTGNTADNGGGASGGNSSHCELINCTLTNNTAATNGGGAYDSTLRHCFLTGNVATNNGGGAYDSELLNCLLTGNTAIINGGGSSGGTLINCTVWGNTATSGGGVLGGTLFNCIVWGNLADDHAGGASFSYSCTTLPPGGPGNIDADPLFMDAANGDFRLQATSPCKDTGFNTYVDWAVDLARNPRIQFGTVDMGAYEYVPVECEVTFEDGLGVVTPTPVSMVVTQGLAYGTLADVDRTGYTFQGWFDDPVGGTQVFDTTIVTNDGPHTLYAQWTTNQYTVIYNDNGATGTTPLSNHTYDVPQNLTLCGFSMTGYTFAGWTNEYDTIVYDDGQLVTNLTDQDGGVVELFATWEPISYTVTYRGDGHTSGDTPDSLHVYDVPASLTLNDFEKTGYLFEGWGWSSGGGVVFTNGQEVVSLTPNDGWIVELYAQWVTNAHTVTFIGNGGEPPVQTEPQAYGEPYQLPLQPIYSGYDFAGWFTDPVGGTLVTGGTINGQTTDHTLYAHWTSAPVGMRLYVNINRPDDLGDGFSWNTAKKTLQAAVDIAEPGFEILVYSGTYAPITANNLSITISNIHDKAVTFIDGGGTTRCATLGNSGLPTDTVLIGFTLINGFADNGGGSQGGTLIDCVLSNNTAAAWGGGAYYGVLNGCTLTNNTATVGGGAYNSTLNGCELSGNTAATDGGGAFNGTLTDCTLIGNVATNNGGGTYGGTVTHCTLSGNTALNDGGGAYNSILRNCLLTGNAADNGGGAQGGTLYNCTLWGNTAAVGGGVYGCMLYNSIVWANFLSDGITPDNYSGGAFDYSCTTPLPGVGAGNIDDDPLFMDAANGDFRLQATSPCINAGDNSYVDWAFDLAGNLRILFGTVDMGAYEYVPVECLVTFEDGLGVVTPTPVSMVVTQGLAYGTLADVARAGYTPTGWFDDPTGGTQVFDTTIVTNDGPHTLYAQWTTNQYTVNYYGDDGTFTTIGTTPDSYHFYDIPANLSSNEFERTGYTFAGWTNAYDTIVYDDGQLVTNLTDQDGGVVELFATWEPISYTVTYRGDGHTSGDTPDSLHVYDVPASLTLNDFEKTGYLFEGWGWSSGGGVVFTNGQEVVNLTPNDGWIVELYAQWATNSHTVTFLGNGGFPASTDVPQAYGEPYVLPFNPTRPDYLFLGWFTEPVGGAEVTDSTIVAVTTNHTLYAQWVNAYTITRLYVDEARPNDNGNGLSWGTAKKTIQAAIDIAPDGIEIWVASGTYGAITTANQNLFIWGVDGAAFTSIDGGHVGRCATLGTSGTQTNTMLQGFTLMNGLATTGAGVSGGTLVDCRLTENAAILGGGSYYSNLDGCELSGNSATLYGGGAYGGTLSDCILSGNTATERGGGAYIGDLYNCVLTNNTSTLGGGVYGGMLTDCTLTENGATNGGGAFGGTLSHCTVSGNTATNDGGGAHDSTLLNCLLTGNTADHRGGGSSGGTLINCTMSGNRAEEGGGVAGGSLSNCIVWENTANDGLSHNHTNGTFRNSCSTPLPGGPGNMDVDPLFEDAANGDFRLYLYSPCVNTGNNAWLVPYLDWWTTDLDGDARIQEGTVDMGAYECPKIYVVTFDAQWAGFEPSPTSMIVTQGLAYGELAIVDPYPTGYTFAGWFTATSGGTEVTATTQVTRASAHTLYAQWTANQYTVTYDGNGATGGDTPDSYHVYDTPSDLTPNGFDKTGYTFAGWATNATDDVVFLDGATVLNLTPEPDGVVTLYAVWTANTYTVRFFGNGGTPAIRWRSQTYDAPYVLPSDPDRTGYVFAGWFTTRTNGTEVTTNTTVTTASNHALFAHWTPLVYDITYLDTKDADNSMNPLTYTIEDDFDFIALTNATGYTFDHWAIPRVDLGTTGPITNTAYWTAHTYTIVYDGNGATRGWTHPSHHTYDTPRPLTPNRYRRTGYTFAGWTNEYSAVVYEDRQLVVNLTPQDGAVIRLYAKWTPNTYTVTFDGNGGDPAATAIEQTYDTPYVLPATSPELTGYTFAGWFTATNGGAQVTSDTTVRRPYDHTLYARWTMNTYTVIYLPNGSALAPVVGDTPPSFHTYDIVTNLTLNGFTRIGYTFAGGWATTPDGPLAYTDGQSVVNLTPDPDGVVYLYAKWIPILYTLTYANTKDVFNPNPETYTIEDSIDFAPLPDIKYNSYEGYAFVSWDPPGIVPGSIGNRTITAQWQWAPDMDGDDMSIPLPGGGSLELKKIPAGTFLMGGSSTGDEDRHQVTLTQDFYIGKYEVTQKQWESVMESNPSYFNNLDVYANRPVERVSYNMIRDPAMDASGYPLTDCFMGRMRTATGLTFDLPTEAQWEYACRADASRPTDFNNDKNLTYPDFPEYCPNMDTLGRYWYNGGRETYGQLGMTDTGTAEVGSYQPNAWGLYDMHGNVWEWCRDWHASRLGTAAVTNPGGPASGSARVARGGSWDSDAYHCRSAHRYGGTPDSHNNNFGFRACVALPNAPHAYTINLDARGGNVSPTLWPVKSDTLYGPLPTPTRTGYLFDGWYTAINGGGRKITASSSVTLTSEHTLFANWIANVPAAIFDGNGGAPAQVLQPQTYGGKYVLPDTNPTRTGYTFAGWFTAAAGGAQITAATTVTQTTVHTLYAQWTANTYTVIFDPQGGTVSLATKQVTFDTAIGTLPAPARDGWYFAGWWTGASGTGERVKTSSLLTALGITLYAYWVDDPVQALFPYLADTDDAAAAPLITTAYDGFAYDADNTVRGTVTLKATATVKRDSKSGIATTNWTFSAKAILQNASVSFSGKLTGVADRFLVTTKAGETLDVTVEEDRFFGTLSGGKAGGTLNVDGAWNAFADKKNGSAQDRLDQVRGLYNVALVDGGEHEDRTLPVGYLSLSVGNLGSVKIAGKLTDGTSVSCSAKLLEGLSENGWHAMALYKPLYSKKGFISGLLWLNPTDNILRVDTDYSWFVNWTCQDTKKETFWRKLDVIGGRFGDGKNAPAMPSGLVFGLGEFEVSALPAPAANLTDDAWVEEAFPWELPVLYGSNGKFTLPKATAPKKTGTIYDYIWGDNPSGATLTFTAATGLFKGSFKLYYDGYTAKGALQHKSISVPYSGVMILARDKAWADAPLGIGIGVTTINKQKVPLPVFLAE